MVFVGANDGMLHAFKLGSLELKWSGQDIDFEKARLTGTDLGKEMWAFIPKNVLPYLKYLKDTEYCHIQSVDLTPYLFDASIEAPGIPSTGNYWQLTKTVNSWRTILIGGMKHGGACRNSTNTTCTDCVKTPIPNVGYSSYFALDVTDQNNPKLLWEFSNENLGFTSSGPAIVRISSRTAGSTSSTADGKTTDGRFFVVFGSGPTGPIDGPSQKFQGRSDQNLQLFVLDLKTGSTVTVIDTGIANAFAGSILNANFDSDLDYQDDAVYIPYVKKCTSTTTYCTANTWTDGGVLRLLTNANLNGNDVSATGNTALNPGNWRYSKVMDGIGPVTSAVTRILNKNTGKLRLYFGTGRYFFRSSTGTDDPSTQRHLFGIVEPCYDGSYKAVCLDNITSNDLTRNVSELGPVDLTTTAGSSDTEGWYITLEAPGVFTYDENGNGTTADDVARTYNSERVITDPLASSTGVVFFTTYKPYNDLCTIGGKTFIWAVKYDTGGAAGSLLQGTALIQVSTGSIEQVRLSTAFTDKGLRRTGSIEGVPPMAQGLSIMTTPSPIKRVIHMRER
jgi:type IV pilus assembly protein PilY1